VAEGVGGGVAEFVDDFASVLNRFAVGEKLSLADQIETDNLNALLQQLANCRARQAIAAVETGFAGGVEPNRDAARFAGGQEENDGDLFVLGLVMEETFLFQKAAALGGFADLFEFDLVGFGKTAADEHFPRAQERAAERRERFRVA